MGVDITQKRGAFLAGKGTMTVEEVHAWAVELGYPMSSLPDGMTLEEPLMVSVVPDHHPWQQARMPVEPPRPTPPYGDLSRPARPC